MSDIIAFCGLNCSQCPSFLATQADDDAARARTSQWMAKTYDIHIPPDQINCDGCPEKEGRLLGYCAQCKVRDCALEKKMTTCADCPDQPCGELKTFHEFSPDAKAAFEKLLSPS